MNKTKFFSSLLVAVLFASTSVFTSCKDYDDDIKNLQTQIDAKALKTDLESLRTSLQGQITTLQSTLDTKIAALQTAVNSKADQAFVNDLASDVVNISAALTALQTKVATIEEALSKYATKEELAIVKAALDGKDTELETAIKQEATDRAAADEALQKAIDKSIAIQKKALEDFQKKLEEDVAKQLEAFGIDAKAIATVMGLDSRVLKIEAALKDFASSSDLAKVKENMQKLSETINEQMAQINTLELYVIKKLTSLVLKPDFYWEGLEGIEVPFAVEHVFTVGKDRTFTYYLSQAGAGNQGVKVTVASSMQYNGVCSELAATEPNGYWIDGYQISLPDASVSLPGMYSWFDAVDAAVKKPAVLVELNQGAIANYHVNPTTAELEGMNIKFFENDAEVYTRAEGAIGATPYSDVFTAGLGNANVYKDGILSIPFYLKNNAALVEMFASWDATTSTNTFPIRDWQFGATGAGEKLPFIAAQLSKGDTIVTSDYAVVVPARLNIVALADNAALEIINGRATEFDADDTNDLHVVRSNHMYESAGYKDEFDVNSNGAIPMPATHEVAYDSIIKIDFVETHYTYQTFVKYGKDSNYAEFDEQVMSPALMRALGLHYEYTLVDYIVGENITGESVHMEQVDATGKKVDDKQSPYFAPRSVTADGKTISNQKATREAIGREPLVRVDLVTEDGKIIRYGYVKIRISEYVEQAKGMEVTVDFNDVYFNCGEQLRVTWSQMENLILAKLGTKGMTKEEFENLYFMDVVGDYTNMPYENPAAKGVTDPEGTLYAAAAANNWMAKRYYKDAKGNYVNAAKSVDDDAMANLADYTADNNWFGRVWYTPHDNSTYGHNWDEATNVIIWDLGSDKDADAHNMTRAAYEKVMQVTGVTYNTKGLNEKPLTTVIRFINKMNGSSIYVTLKLDAKKLHFATADINRRVLDHWYDFADGYKDNTADTIEVYANVPTPALTGQVDLNTYSFRKDLKEYWLNQKVVPTVNNAGKFTKFTTDKLTPKFMFRLPVKGEKTNVIDEATGLWVNSTTTNFKTGKVYIDGVETDGINYWEVKGASGKTYQLYLSDGTTIGGLYGTGIIASLGKGKQDELICIIDPWEGVVQYCGYDVATAYTPEQTLAKAGVNSAATDILNYIGMYDKTGKLQKDTYMDGQNTTFAAYVEIKMLSSVCYDPLMGKNCFNVRFLRPVNIWPAETKWKDAPNATQVYPIWKLVYIRDWRQYAVVPAGLTQQFGAAAVAGTGLDGKLHKGDFTEGNVTYQFYGIENLYVMRDQIRSDAHKAPSLRVIKTDEQEMIANTLPITDIPALTGTNTTYGKWEFLKIYADQGTEDATKLAAGAAATGLAESTHFTNYLAYTNNGGVVKEFHVYVPIALKYPWGSVCDWTQKVWAVITIDPTQGNE